VCSSAGKSAPTVRSYETDTDPAAVLASGQDVALFVDSAIGWWEASHTGKFT
jgi:hypothetical protein